MRLFPCLWQEENIGKKQNSSSNGKQIDGKSKETNTITRYLIGDELISNESILFPKTSSFDVKIENAFEW